MNWWGKLNNKFILTTASTPNEFSLTFENKDYTSWGITADEIAKRLSEKFYINITNPTLKDNILTYIDTSWKEWSVNINSGKIGDVSFSMSDKDLVLRKQGWSGTNSSPETITYDEADTDIEDKAMYDLDKAVKDSDIRKLFEKLEKEHEVIEWNATSGQYWFADEKATMTKIKETNEKMEKLGNLA